MKLKYHVYSNLTIVDSKYTKKVVALFLFWGVIIKQLYILFGFMESVGSSIKVKRTMFVVTLS